jgi:quercetin dioxygenase-like cupin family protein
MTAQSLIVQPGEGRVWNMEPGSRPATFKLLSDQTGGSISVFEEIVPMGGGAPLHIHPDSDEVIQIVTGDFTIRLGEQVTKVGAGGWVFIPRGVAHAWKNSGSEDARAIYIFTPAQNAKFFEELSKFNLPMWSIDPANFESYAQRYGYQLIDPNPSFD